MNHGAVSGTAIVNAVEHSYEFEVDTEKQRQRRDYDTRLTKSRNARSEQLSLAARNLIVMLLKC